MQYKAIFDIPDDIVPPPTVGFQFGIMVQTEQGPQIQPQIYKAILQPIKSKLEECNNYREVKNDT